MIIYKDILTGAECVSDAFKIEEKDSVLEVDGQLITIKQGAGDINIGANPSAEEGGGETFDDDDVVTVSNIEHTFGLQSFGDMDKKAFMGYAKAYMKALEKKFTELGKDEEFIKGFKERAKQYVLRISKDIKDFEMYYAGELVGDEMLLIPKNFREDGMTPYYVYFKDGLESEKV